MNLLTIFTFFFCTGEAINDVINQNFELLSKDVQPLVERALEKNLKEISNKIITRYTHEQLFPH